MADGIVQAGDGAVRLIPYAAECCAVDRARGPFPHQPLNTTPNTLPPHAGAHACRKGAACRCWLHAGGRHGPAHPSMAMHTMRTLPWPCTPCAPPIPMRAPVLDLCVGITAGSVSGICTCALPSLGLRSGALPPSFFLGAAMEAGPSSPTSSSKLSKAGAGFEVTGAGGFGGGGGGAVVVVTSGSATSFCPTSSSSPPEVFTLNFRCFPDISQPIESADRLRSRTPGESVTKVRRGRARSPEHGSRRIGSAWIMPHWGSAPLHWHFQMVGYPPCNQARAHSALTTACLLCADFVDFRMLHAQILAFPGYAPGQCQVCKLPSRRGRPVLCAVHCTPMFFWSTHTAQSVSLPLTSPAARCCRSSRRPT